MNAAAPSNRIRELRDAAGLSLSALAKATGISIAQISRLELGARRLTPDAREALAQAIGVEPVELGKIDEDNATAAPDALSVPTKMATAFAAAFAARDSGIELKPARDQDVPIRALVAWPLNPRRQARPAAIEELAESIFRQGVLQPLLTRAVPELGYLEVIAGERRRQAVALLVERGRVDRDFPVPVRVVEFSNVDALLAAGAENLARDGMHPLDESELFATLNAHGFTKADISARLGVSLRTVERRLFLSNLSDAAKDLFRDGGISQAQAEALAGGDLAGQARVMEFPGFRNYSADVIRRLLNEVMPEAEAALFDVAAYEAAGGQWVEDEDGNRLFRDVEIFHDLQEKALAAITADLATAFAWVDRVVFAMPQYYDLKRPDGYRTPKEGDVEPVGALIVTSPDLSLHTIYRGVLRPAEAVPEPEQIPLFDDVDDADGEDGEDGASEFDDAVDAPAEPAKPEDPGTRDGEASRLQTIDQIRAVRAAQTKALRQGIAQNAKAALAYTILIQLGAVPQLKLDCPHYERAPEAKTEVTEALVKLAMIWDSAPDPAKVTFLYELGHFWRENIGRAADCYRALVEFADEAALLDLLAALVACRVAVWHNEGEKLATSSAPPLTVAVAQHVRAAEFMPYHWRPEADYWKGYDRTGLKTALVAGGQDLAAFKKAGKNELIQACASLDGKDTLSLPELAFMTSADQQDAVIEARGKIVAAERKAAPDAPDAPEGEAA